MKYLFFLIVLISSAACTKNDKLTGGEPVQDEVINNISEINDEPPHVSLEQVIANYEEGTDEYISSIQTINAGILGGENFLVSWRTPGYDLAESLAIYTIKDAVIVKKYDVPYRAITSTYLDYDIMEGIPGKRLEQHLVTIHDFNGDGFDDMLFLEPTWIKPSLGICGYDKDKDEIKEYCRVRYEMDETADKFLPVQFIPYGELNGFRVYDKYQGNYYWGYYYWSSEINDFISPDRYTPPDGRGY